MNKILFFMSLLAAVLMAGCDSGSSGSSVLSDAPGTSSTFKFPMPERIRTSRVVDLSALSAEVDTNSGSTFDLTPDAANTEFTGSINVEFGSTFAYTLSIYETVGGNRIDYFSIGASVDQAVTQDLDIRIPLTALDNPIYYPDADGDGFSNFDERDAGSDHLSTFSTPSNPDGVAPTETNPGLIQFTSETFNASENDGTLTISVSRQGGSDGRVTAQYQLRSETATIGRDFVAASGQLVWEDGETQTNTFDIELLSDDLNDGDETFTASLFAPTGGAGISSGFARITLLDSTPPPQRGSIRLTSSIVEVDENAGAVEVVVERINGNDGLVTVDYVTVAGSATNNDFTAVIEPRVIRWADGEDGPRVIRININNDNEQESTEAFTVELSNSLGGATLGLASTTVSINDTTPAPAPEPEPEPEPEPAPEPEPVPEPAPEPEPPVAVPGLLSLFSSNSVVGEGDSIELVVERTGGTDGIVSLDYNTVAGSADTSDFTATNGTLIWLDGDGTSRTITIDTIADSELESDEELTVVFSNATGGVTVATTTATVTIADTTVSQPGTLSFSSTAVNVIEGESVDISVTRTGGTDGAVSVSVDAPASTEFTISPATLNWTDGESETMTITLTANSDAITGDTEQLSISLSGATGGASIGSSSITATITDTTVPPIANGFVPRDTDGEWEVCFEPFNTPGPTAFATQLSVNESRIVQCIKTCTAADTIFDPAFDGWAWNPADLHSCIATTDPAGTYTNVPVYTPGRETINTNLSTGNFARDDSIWACVTESRVNAEVDYVPNLTNTDYFQFLDDGTYLYGSSADGNQPEVLLGPAVWSAEGRVLELSHLNIGFRNTLFPDSQTLHVHPDTDRRLNCSLESRVTVSEPEIETDPEDEVETSDEDEDEQ